MIAEWSIEDGEGIVPPLLLQPIAPADVAVALVDAAESPALGGSFDIAGPRTEDAVDMARRTLAAWGVSFRCAPRGRVPRSASSSRVRCCFLATTRGRRRRPSTTGCPPKPADTPTGSGAPSPVPSLRMHDQGPIVGRKPRNGRAGATGSCGRGGQRPCLRSGPTTPDARPGSGRGTRSRNGRAGATESCNRGGMSGGRGPRTLPGRSPRLEAPGRSPATPAPKAETWACPPRFPCATGSARPGCTCR